MRLIIFTIIVFTFFQCRQSIEITGAWLHTTDITNDGKRISEYGRQIFDFKKDSVILTSLGDLEVADLAVNKIISGSYKTVNNRLIIETNEEKIKAKVTYSTDSLVLIFRKYDNNKIVLKRLLENDKCEIQKAQFISKSFSLSSGKYTDSIYFLNDTLMLHCGNSNLSRPLENWELTNYQGFKFFHTTNPLFPGMVVNKYSDSTITLNPYIKLNVDLKLTCVTSQNKRECLIGTWTETERTAIANLSYGYVELNDSLKLEIEADKIVITKNARTETMKWKITPDFSRIYFLSEDKLYFDSWKIIEMTKSKLKLRITDKSGMYDYIVVMARNEDGQ